MTLFQRYGDAHIPCDIKAAGKGRDMKVTCWKGNTHKKTVYEASLVGAGYLFIEKASIDGKPLKGKALVDHVTKIYAGGRP